MSDGAQSIPEFFDGNVLRPSAVAGLMLGEVLYAPNRKRPEHTHEHACFHFLLEGGYTERLASRSQECKAFTLAFQPQGHEHSYCCFKHQSLSPINVRRLSYHGVLRIIIINNNIRSFLGSRLGIIELLSRYVALLVNNRSALDLKWCYEVLSQRGLARSVRPIYGDANRMRLLNLDNSTYKII